MTFDLSSHGLLTLHRLRTCTILLIAITVFALHPEAGIVLVNAATLPLDKNSLYALSGHVFVGTITEIETKIYTDPANDDWKEKHFLLTVKVTTVIKSASHTNSLSGDYDFQTKMSTAIDESVTEESIVNVLTSSTLSLPKGWTGDTGQHEQLRKYDVHTFYCTYLGRKRFQFDKTFPFVGSSLEGKQENDHPQHQKQHDTQNIGQQHPLQLSHANVNRNAYLPLSPNGIGPVVGHEDRIDDAALTPAETYHFVDEQENTSFNDTQQSSKMNSTTNDDQSETDINSGNSANELEDISSVEDSSQENTNVHDDADL